MLKNHLIAMSLVGAALITCSASKAQQPAAPNRTPLEFIRGEGQSKSTVPITPAVKVGNLVFVSGTPGFDKTGKLAVGDFGAQMKQVMENIAGTLKASGAVWDRVVKVNVMLTRREDFEEMNRIYATYFPSGNYPARTTVVVSSLPSPNFLLEIECVAALD
jgi:reactive intermediate/imine deaminase